MSLYNPKQGTLLMHVQGNSIEHAHCPTTDYLTKIEQF